MKMYEAIHKILDKVGDDIELAAIDVYDGPKKIAMEVLRVGLMTISARRRRVNRREITREIQPKYQRNPQGASILTAQSKKILASHAQRLFGPDGWKIGRLYLGDFTKEGLLEQAETERRSAKGHLQNAEFYEALAEPLQPGQTVREYWKSGDAVALKDTIWKKAKEQTPKLT